MGATTGAIVFVVIVALLAFLCRKRYLKRVRRRATLDPFQEVEFLDLDNEMVAVNQPLILGDGHGSQLAVYSDPFTDDSQPRNQMRTPSPAVGTGGLTGGRNSISHAVVGTVQTLTPEPDPEGGQAAEHYNQHQPIDQQPSAPSQRSPPPEITRSRTPQSLPQVQTQFPPQFPVPRPSSPAFDAGAGSYLSYADQTTDRRPPSPNHYSPGNAEGHVLTSAFRPTSELSPQYTTHFPPPNIDAVWGNSPDPIKGYSLSRRPSLDSRHSLTPSVGGPVYDLGDTTVITPLDSPTQDSAQDPPSPESAYSQSPSTVRGSNHASRPSPITEIVEMLAHPQDGSGDSGTWVSTRSDTSASSPVVMTAERVRVTPGRSVSVRVPAYTKPPGPSTDSYYGQPLLPAAETTKKFPRLPPPPDGPRPLPPLLQVQPLNIGKKKSVQGPP